MAQRMTRDEWEARMVERTLCNDWINGLEKQIWSCGPCASCGTLLAIMVVPTHEGALAHGPRHLFCDCRETKALLFDGSIVPPCDTCGTLVDTVAEQVEADHRKYSRITCECGRLKTRI